MMRWRIRPPLTKARSVVVAPIAQVSLVMPAIASGMTKSNSSSLQALQWPTS
jgi:ABC-type enterobactin transport system permease subunit